MSKLFAYRNVILENISTLIEQIEESKSLTFSKEEIENYEEELNLLCIGVPDFVNRQEVPGSEIANQRKYLALIPKLVRGTTDKSCNSKTRRVELKNLSWIVKNIKLKDLKNVENPETDFRTQILQTIVDCFNIA